MVNSPLIRPYLLGGGSFGGSTLFPWPLLRICGKLKSENTPLVGGWFQPIWKICSSNWIISPQNRGEHSKNLWVATTQITIFQVQTPYLREISSSTSGDFWAFGPMVSIFHTRFKPTKTWPLGLNVKKKTAVDLVCIIFRQNMTNPYQTKNTSC